MCTGSVGLAVASGVLNQILNQFQLAVLLELTVLVLAPIRGQSPVVAGLKIQLDSRQNQWHSMALHYLG